MAKKDLVTLMNWTSEEVRSVIDLAIDVKKNPGTYRNSLQGKSLGMIFEKSSTRTRVSFQAGMTQLGGQSYFLSSKDLQLGRGETIDDTARVLSRYLDVIMARTFQQETIETLAKYSTVPVINGLSNRFHPCQVLADALTIKENFGHFEEIKFAYVGDGNNMAHSLMIIAALLNFELSILGPDGFHPDKDIVDWATARGNISVTSDIDKGIAGANVVYTDVWTSMGDEGEEEERISRFKDYQVNDALMAKAQSNAIFLHCLPAHREEEVSASVIDGSQSRVWDQAENRMHAQKALLLKLVVT